MLQTSTVAESTIIDENLIPEIKMLGYLFDFERIKSRIVKMTDSPDRIYSTAPLKKEK